MEECTEYKRLGLRLTHLARKAEPFFPQVASKRILLKYLQIYTQFRVPCDPTNILIFWDLQCLFAFLRVIID